MSDPLKKVLFFANTEWYLFNFRLGLAKYLVERGIEVVMVSPPGPYGAKLEAEGFRWIQVPMQRRSLNPWHELRLLWRLVSIYRAEQPDIAHHFTIKCVVYGGLVAHLARVRNVVSAVTGLGYVFIGQDWLAKLLRPIVRLFLKTAMNGRNRRLILQNPDDQQLFLNARLVQEQYIHIIAGSGVNTALFKPKARPNLDDTRRIKVVFAARLLWDKGLGEFVAAAQLLTLEGTTAEFVIVGSADPGNPASVPETVLEAWRAIPAVKLLGHASNMATILESADIMVLPSYREGLPRGLIEAAAAGLPIITTDAPGCREVVEDGVNGFLVPVRDSVKLAVAIKKLVDDPALAVRMGAAGRQKALAEFDERLVFERTFAVYRELLPNP